jgi:STE24 endopeptidase
VFLVQFTKNREILNIPMKYLLIAVFTAYVLIKLFEYWLEYLNYTYLKKFGTDIPDGFEKVVNQEKLDKIRSYTIEKIRFGIFSSVYEAIILLVFLFTGLFNLYSKWLLDLNLPFIVSAILFFLFIAYVHTLLQIPFSLYRTFKLERKFGFNTMTMKLWISDLFKTLLISTVLLAVLCTGALYLVSASPSLWWLWVWILFFIFTLFIMYISPYILEPLFNKFVPVDDDELSASLGALMKKVGIKISKVLKMDASKRTKHTNAYFTGIGGVKRIVLFDTMLDKMSKNEILSVVAHEGGHWEKKHIIKNIILFEIISLIFFYVAYCLIESNFLLLLFNIDIGHNFADIYLFPVKVFLLQFLFGIVMFPFSPVFHLLSRIFERQADRFAVKLIGTPGYLIEALIKLSADNLSNLHPHPFYSAFYYSHPGVQERIKYLKSLKINTKTNIE